jgi:hypothetical protein
MTAQERVKLLSQRAEALTGRLVDTFSDDRAAGTVIGTSTTSGQTRLGRDIERQIAVDHGALRFQPLIIPGWARQGIAYGPFRREPGLVLAVSITNGHNTSQGTPIPEHIIKRFGRWLLGPGVDPWPARLLALVRGPRKKGTLRRFWWWMRSTNRTFLQPPLNENLAVGWFTSEAPGAPPNDGCGFVIHAAEGENGELWARVGSRCLSAFRRLKNLRVYYVVVLRKRGAIYYAAASQGAHGLPGFPMMRPIAIDPDNDDETLYAGIHQSVLGQIGFRVDTRVYGVHIERLPEFSSVSGMALACDPLPGNWPPEDAGGLHGGWRVRRVTVTGVEGDDIRLAVLEPNAPSGLIHALIDAGDSPARIGIAWRILDTSNFWLLSLSTECCTLGRVHNGRQELLACDTRRVFAPNATHSVQILDGGGQIGCYLDGERLFDAWFEDPALEDATGVGMLLNEECAVRVRDFEAHGREVPMPSAIRFDGPWQRVGEHIGAADDFGGASGDLDGRTPTLGDGRWERTLGIGCIEGGGARAQVRASREKPHPGRTFYTLPWAQPAFADLEVTITPPGHGRGEGHYCRSGLVFWQDRDNYLSFTAYVDDVYNGSSIALFTKRHGFEELYDAIWTMLWDKFHWGKPSRLRVAFDGNRFAVFVDNEPVMQRALTDLYPEDPPLRIVRVGLATNWEWGNDTGSTFQSLTARY